MESVTFPHIFEEKWNSELLGRRRPARPSAPRREGMGALNTGIDRPGRPPARGGRSGAGPPVRPPRVVAGILARMADPRPGHARHGRVSATAVTPLALNQGGYG